ncbi:MAG: hypothetical protein AAF220_03390 [Pseudomonadota bacterium]
MRGVAAVDAAAPRGALGPTIGIAVGRDRFHSTTIGISSGGACEGVVGRMPAKRCFNGDPRRAGGAR